MRRILAVFAGLLIPAAVIACWPTVPSNDAGAAGAAGANPDATIHKLGDYPVPQGPAGGALIGNFPNPGLDASAVINAVGTLAPAHGGTGNTAVGTNGQCEVWDGGVLNPVACATSLPPSGAAGGALTGTYPNPGLDAGAVIAAIGVLPIANGGTNYSSAGSTGQCIIVDGGSWTPETCPVTACSGDLNSGCSQVTAISGSTPIAISPNELRWAKTATPLLDQLTPTTDTAPANLTIQSQAPFASAVTNLQSGALKFVIPPPVGAGNHNWSTFYDGTTLEAQIGSYPTNASFGAVFLGNVNATIGGNATIASSGSTTYLNVPTGATGNITVNIGTTIGSWSSAGITSSVALTANSAFTVAGSMTLQTVTKTSNYTIDSSTPDIYVLTDSSGGAFSVTLPTATAGRTLFLIDSTGSAGTHTVTLHRPASDNINGIKTDYLLTTNWFNVRVMSDGTDWYVN